MMSMTATLDRPWFPVPIRDLARACSSHVVGREAIEVKLVIDKPCCRCGGHTASLAAST